MARIPETEIERLKREVAVERLAEARPVPNRVEMREAHSSGGDQTTESPPGRAVGGVRHGQGYPEASSC
jgi:hypothetical protein